jgi:hypothetical protein
MTIAILLSLVLIAGLIAVLCIPGVGALVVGRQPGRRPGRRAGLHLVAPLAASRGDGRRPAGDARQSPARRRVSHPPPRRTVDRARPGDAAAPRVAGVQRDAVRARRAKP